LKVAKLQFSSVGVPRKIKVCFSLDASGLESKLRTDLSPSENFLNVNATADASYSRLSSPAVISAIFGMMTLLGFLIPELAAMAIVGLVSGLLALRETRKYELCGRRFAVFGVIASVSFAVSTPIWHRALFDFEALPGYARLDFALLTKGTSSSLDQFTDERVCLKGYALIPMRGAATDRFILSTNGDNKRLDAAVAVKLGAGQTWNWREESLAVSGTLVPNPAAMIDPAVPKFLLVDATVRSARSQHQLVSRVYGGC
jgi:hypothetical protein